MKAGNSRSWSLESPSTKLTLMSVFWRVKVDILAEERNLEDVVDSTMKGDLSRSSMKGVFEWCIRC